jgi:hypothetical protein
MRDMTIKLNVAASYKCAYSFFLKINMQAVQKKKKKMISGIDLHWNYHISTLPI